MSKAFTKEQDGAEDGDDIEIQAPQIPAGAKNYMTPGGAKRMQEELRDLLYKKRPEIVQTVSWAAENGDRSENGDYIYGKKKLREIDRRVRFLSKRLDKVEVVDPLAAACDHVRFGATVTIRDEDDRERTYAIVGVDEADASQGKISWASPLATALLKAKEGDLVLFRSPKGVQEIEVVAVEYKEIP
jgi:transcription elongation factor GreB